MARSELAPMARAFLLGSGLSGLTLLLGAATAKILALAMGPEGMGRYGLFVQVMQATLMAASLGGSGALMQGLASRPVDQHPPFLRQVSKIHGASTACSLLVALGLLASPVGTPLREALPLSTWLGVAPLVVLGTVQVIVLGLLGARQAVGRQGLAHAAGALTALLLAGLAYRSLAAGKTDTFVLLQGGMLGVATFVSWRLLRHAGPPRSPNSTLRPRPYLVVALGTLATGLVAPLALVALRTALVRHDGLAAAGLFHAAWMVASGYMLAVLSAFAAHLLPALAHEESAAARGPLLDQALTIVVRWIAPLATLGLAFREEVLTLLYAPAFHEAGPLLRWLLPAAVLRGMAWVLAMPLASRAELKRMLGVEVAWHAIFLAPLALPLLDRPLFPWLGPSALAGSVVHLVLAGLLAKRHHGWRPSPLAWPLARVVLVLGATAGSPATGPELWAIGGAGAGLLVMWARRPWSDEPRAEA